MINWDEYWIVKQRMAERHREAERLRLVELARREAPARPAGALRAGLGSGLVRLGLLVAGATATRTRPAAAGGRGGS
ncbi:MAG TPA: hypothetical protein VKF59_17300 [Candidatus Dormibacteraeota bacterium]|nr:hypothetical protein [Candidatus Dormibacteraeota bacterium]